MSVRDRLALTLTVLGLLLVLPSIYGLKRLGELRDIAFELHGRQSEAAAAVQQVRLALDGVDRFARSYIIVPDSTSREAMWRSVEQADAAADRVQGMGYHQEASGLSTDLAEIEASIAHVATLVEAGRAGEATDHFQGIKDLLEHARASIIPLSEAIDRKRTVAAARAAAISASAEETIWIASSAAIALAVLLGLWITRGLTGPIARLKLAMARVAEGDFEAPQGLPYARTDEFGDLSRSFRSMAGQLAELQRLRAEFVSIASHELKTPLNVIGGYAEILDEGQFGEVTVEQRESLRAISDQVSLLSRLVNHLLDLSRFEAGAFQLQMEEVHVGDLLASVSTAFEALTRPQEVELVVQIDPTAPPIVTGDLDRLRNEVLGNLLSNAFKFTPRGGRITVRASGFEGGLRLEVEDTGEGIPPDQLPRVFEKFYQHRSQARSQGSGLGLAIARDIVEAHGGTIDVTSELGKGTTFWFTLPVPAAAQSLPAEPQRKVG